MKILSPYLKVKIRGYGRSWPSVAYSNIDLLKMNPETVGKDEAVLAHLADKIQSKWGFNHRFLAQRPGDPLSPDSMTSEDLALKAVKEALIQNPGFHPEIFIHGTTTSRRYTGSQATSILGKVGLEIPAYEIKAGCSTSIASLHLAQSFLKSGYKSVLVSCAETLSKVMHPEIRETWFGLADAGAAVWLEVDDESPDFTLLKSGYSTDGRHVDMYTTTGDLPPRNVDVEANKFALSGDSSQLRELSKIRYLEMINLLVPTEGSKSRARWLIAHQVNKGLVTEILTETKWQPELIWSAAEFGNVGGTSVLFSLAQAFEENKFKSGDEIILLSVGGGLSFACQHWKKN
ncbi:MAG: 3-oxoacyl-ACP synthase [Bdellovibrionales bacterium]|nr:3-oxoacyl-ACP synthase [Bdellovibrionales bacterium]